MLEAIFGECLNYKGGLRILIWSFEVPFFFGLKGGHFWQKPNLVLVFKNPKQSKKSKKIQEIQKPN